MLRQKPDEPLVSRVADFFERQIAWYGCVLEDLASSADAEMDEQALDEIEARRCAYNRDLQDQQQELEALLAEWQKAPEPPAADLQRIRALAKKAEEAAARAAGALHKAAAGMGARAGETRRSLQNLRNGRRAFGGYRVAQPDTGILDEKA